MPDWNAIAEALADTIGTGSYNGSQIDAAVLKGAGLLNPPCVRVTTPRVMYDHMGEGARAQMSEWDLRLYTASRNELDPEMDMAFLDSVVEALNNDPRLGGMVAMAVPTISEPPTKQPMSKQRGASRDLFVRILTVQCYH